MMKISRSGLLLLSLQIGLFAVFVYHSSWRSLLYFILFAGSVMVTPLFLQSRGKNTPRKPEKTKDILDKLYPLISEQEEKQRVIDAVMKLVQYNVEDNPCLQNFEIVRKNSNCIFAKKAKLWGSPAWNDNLTLEGNIYRMLAMFVQFTVVCPREKLDGFLVELPGDKYGHSVKAFGDGLREVLTMLSDFDPAEVHCMRRSYVGKRGWVFEFNKTTFFITTFAPFYPSNHPRYSFGAGNCYILFQPELSFGFHDLTPDTPNTEWTDPKTVRDRIRVAFKEAGRPYLIPESLSGSMALEMLRPIHEDDEIYEWWKEK